MLTFYNTKKISTNSQGIVFNYAALLNYEFDYRISNIACCSNNAGTGLDHAWPHKVRSIGEQQVKVLHPCEALGEGKELKAMLLGSSIAYRYRFFPWKFVSIPHPFLTLESGKRDRPCLFTTWQQLGMHLHVATFLIIKANTKLQLQPIIATLKSHSNGGRGIWICLNHKLRLKLISTTNCGAYSVIVVMFISFVMTFLHCTWLNSIII